ncbi:acetyltransferase, GNAT family, partial [Ostertagia ostertagi]
NGRLRVNRATPADAPSSYEYDQRARQNLRKCPKLLRLMKCDWLAILRRSPLTVLCCMKVMNRRQFFSSTMPTTWEDNISIWRTYVHHIRRKGYGRLLWRELGVLAKELHVERLQWNVLDWNSNAIAFYETLPCENLTKKEGWLLYRLDAEGIAALAQPKNSTPRQEQKLQNGSE